MTNSSSLKCLLINLQHSMVAAAALHQLMRELDLDIIFVQEPYVTRNGQIADILPEYSSFHRLDPNHRYGSAIIYKTSLNCLHLVDHSSNEIARIEVKCHSHPISCYSLYCRPLHESASDFISPLLLRPDFKKRNSILCLDANAHSPLWNSNFTDTKGRYFVFLHKL